MDEMSVAIQRVGVKEDWDDETGLVWMDGRKFDFCRENRSHRPSWRTYRANRSFVVGVLRYIDRAP